MKFRVRYPDFGGVRGSIPRLQGVGGGWKFGVRYPGSRGWVSLEVWGSIPRLLWRSVSLCCVFTVAGVPGDGYFLFWNSGRWGVKSPGGER